MIQANISRFIRCFLLARKVVHYYWMHTDGDYPGQRVRIENIQRVVQRITQIHIEKVLVPFEGEHIRGVTERYRDRATIYIRAGQPIEWEKYATVKEYCHLLYDVEEDYEANPVKTLEQLVRHRNIFIEDEMPAAVISENLAETLALELLYPVEYREEDAKFLAEGGSMAELVEKRHVPAVHIQIANDPGYTKACKEIWASLPENDLPELPEFPQ